jgi:hypothetical protein
MPGRRLRYHARKGKDGHGKGVVVPQVCPVFLSDRERDWIDGGLMLEYTARRLAVILNVRLSF